MSKTLPSDIDLYTAASYACVRLLPRSQSASYVLDIRAKFKAEPIVYFLQALSHGMTTIFVGLLTNYLYDKAAAKGKAKRRRELHRAIEAQRRELERLSEAIEDAKIERPAKSHLRRYETYRDIQDRVEARDPSINAVVEDVIQQLERRGAAPLKKSVDSKWPRRK